MNLPADCLPEIEVLRQRAQSLAMLDALLSPEWLDRIFSFDAAWGENEQMASMRNGEGDEWFILFDAHGAACKGYVHETKAAQDRRFADEIQSRLPKQFSAFLHEAAFSMQDASFCYWRSWNDSAWQRLNHPDLTMADLDDGSDFLALLIEPASAYQEFAQDYFEIAVPIEAIEQIFAHVALTQTLANSINPELEPGEIEALAMEIAYPLEMRA